MTRILTIFLLFFATTRAFSQTVDSFYVNPERIPEYPGGGAALEYFLTENIIYPQSAIRDSMEGTVELKLWIDRLGRMVKEEVTKSLYPVLDTEAMNVAAMVPRWRAAMQSGYHVGGTLTVPVKFTLPNKPSSLVRHADKAPEYPGGVEASLKFLRKNMEYPENAVVHEKQGRLIVKFIIDDKGHVQDPVILKSVCEPIDKEVLRVVKLMQWKPALQGGKPVGVYYTIPIDFQLQGTKSVIKEQQLLIPFGNATGALGD